MKTETLYFSSKLAVKVAKLFSKKFFLSLQTKQGVFEVLKKRCYFKSLQRSSAIAPGRRRVLHLQGFSARIAASEEGAGFRSVADLVTASARAGGFSGIIAPEVFDCNLHIIYCSFLFPQHILL